MRKAQKGEPFFFERKLPNFPLGIFGRRDMEGGRVIEEEWWKERVNCLFGRKEKSPSK